MFVEEIGNEGEIEFVISSGHISRRYEFATIELLSFIEHGTGTRDVSLNCQRGQRDSASNRSDLVKKVSVDFRIDDVGSEVVKTALSAGSLQMVINPSHEDLLRRQSPQVVKGLPVAQKSEQSGAVLQVDLVEQSDSNDLPQKTENEMGCSLAQIDVVNVDDVAPDSLG